MRIDRIKLDRRTLVGAGTAAAVTPFSVFARSRGTSTSFAMGRDQEFCEDWQFYRGILSGAEAPGFDDGTWRTLDLPHDWSIEDCPSGQAPDQLGPFDKNAVGGLAAGFTVGGEGWYRKHFRLANLPAGSKVSIQFAGVSVTCDVWLNGQLVGSHVHPYAIFTLDLTSAARLGSDNVIAVRVRNEGQNSRWYAGSGIYRAVSLTVLPSAASLADNGVGIWTRSIIDGVAQVEINTQCAGDTQGLELRQRLVSASGQTVASVRGAAGPETRQNLGIKAPKLWSPASPYLYQLVTELYRGSELLDRMSQSIGLRIVSITPNHGLLINGEPVKLRGGCLHHDNGLLGACSFPDAEERRVLLLKERGYNAIRSSHNPASPHLRAACDRHGVLLIEEAFDMWHVGKTKNDYSQYFPKDWSNVVRSLVLSARNSPSVIMWSIGNEIPYRSSAAGIEWSWKLANEVRRLDPTRPVTAALNGVLGNVVVPAAGTARQGRADMADNASSVFLDVAGYNYRLEQIENDHAAHPDRIIYASETFARDAYDYARLAERAPYMLGEFVWTAMDYIGEAGIAATVRLPKSGLPYFMAKYPWISAFCGDLDLIGDQKIPSRMRDVVWGVSTLEIAVQRPIPDDKREIVPSWGWPDEVESWNWEGNVGKPVSVRAYTAADRVVAFLNGKEVAKHDLSPSDKMRAELSIVYEPGHLEVRAYRDNAEIARRSLETTGPVARIKLTPERRAGRSQGRSSLQYVGIELVDAQGRRVLDADASISLALAGGGDLIGYGSASPLAVGSFKATSAKTFKGRAMAIVRASRDPAPIMLTAHAQGLAPATARIDTAKG